MSNTLREQTEEQVLTFSNLSFIFETHVEVQKDKLLRDLHFDLQTRILKTTTCIDVMFRLWDIDSPILRVYNYDSFEKDLNSSSKGKTVRGAYFKVWEMYENFFRVKLEPIYNESIKRAIELALSIGKNTSDPVELEESVRLFGYNDFECLMISVFYETQTKQA